MGYLTTLTIYNDGIDQLKDPEKAIKFCRDVYDAALSHETREIAVGNFVNMVEVQRSRHADDHAVYVHAGNCLFNVTQPRETLMELRLRVPKFFATLLAEVEDAAQVLRSIDNAVED